MIQIAPSMLSADFLHLEKDVEMVNGCADIFHLDIMDGVLVPNISYGFPVIEAIAKKAVKPMDAHLMIVHPEKYFERFAKTGVKMMSFHLEAADRDGNDPAEMLDMIKSYGIKAGLAINPDIAPERVFPYLEKADYILVMSVFAGFGGQGILFAGKVVAYAGLIEGRELSWLPSYGPEMRGGTANCSICLSDEPIGSPLVTNPNVLIAMNRPSLDKFVNEVEPGGTILLDSSLIDERVERDDVTVFYVPASKLAEENGLKGLANIILVGKLRKELAFCTEETLDKALQKCIPARKADMLGFNRKALEIGKAQ